MSHFDEIERLGELREKGLLTQEEFDDQKKLILGLIRAPQNTLASNLKNVASSIVSNAAQATSDLKIQDNETIEQTSKLDLSSLKTPLGIACIVSFGSMFMTWAFRSSGWSVVEAMDSGLLLGMYMFPIGAVMILYQQVIQGKRPRGYWKLTGLLPLLLPVFVILGDFDRLEMLMKYGGVGKAFELMFDTMFDTMRFGYKLAVISGVVVFFQARKGERYLDEED